MLCDLVVGKIINLDYCKYCRNPFSEMTYHVQSFMAFKPDELGHNPSHGIVCSNDPILCTCVHIRMANKVKIDSFHFLCLKINFHFLSVKIGFSCEGSTKNTLQN
jgi:hypothetical protein